MKYFLLVSAVSFSLLSAQAQTGPAGVGNSGNNVIWLNADVLTYSTVPDISSWPDQSGNGNDFSQSTSSRQPSRVTYPGFQALRFDGGDFVRTGSIAAMNANTHTQYVVYSGFRPNHTGILYEASFSQSSQFIRSFRLNGQYRSWVLNGSLGAVTNSTTNSSSFQIMSSYWDGTAQTFTSYKDGALIGTQVGANGSPSGNYTNTVGAASNNSYKFDGDIGEVIIYNTVLNSAQRNIVDNYLSTKFGVSIANDLYAYDASHQYQLIGVGQESDGNNLVAQGAGIVELNASGFANGDYILTAHNNTALSQTTNDVPASISGGTRITRTWRVGTAGSPGNIDVDIDVSSLPLQSGSYYLIVESANGVFNDGGTVEYGPVADVGGIASFTNVALADGDYFSIGTDNGSTIVSKKTGFWDVASTWNCNCVPGGTDDVTIQNGHTVTARTITNVHDVTINGTLNSQQTGSFNVKGDYAVGATGSVVHKSITFNGTTGSQNISSAAAGTVSFKTVIINNSSNVAIQSGAFSISNSLNVSNGQFQNVGGSCTLLSDATSTAVITNGSGGFSGTFVLQRYMSGRNANWGDLSSPVSNATLGSWDSDQSGTVTEIYMSGVNGIDGVAGGFESVYRYDAPTQTYIAITDTNYALPAGEAVELWMADDPTSWFAKTFDTHGTPNFGNVAVSVSNSWNLVGNPYQAWISWSALTKPTLNGTYYMYNTNTGSYDAFTSGNIPPCHGFWVESVGAGTLTFRESSKTGSGSSSFYRNAAEDEEPVTFTEVMLKVSSQLNTYSHELKLRMNNLATTAHDAYDGSFLKSRLNDVPSITSFADNSNKELAINSFNYQDEVVIPIKVNVGVTGEYQIDPINFNELANDFEYIEFKDLQTGKIWDLKGYFREAIQVDVDEKDDTERFELRLSNLKGSASVAENGEINIYKSDEQTVIELGNNDLNYQITVYNAIGQKVMETFNASNTDKVFINNSQLPSGVNIIQVTSVEGNFTQKLTY
ncbi:MAG: T9SS type A sorting domain-containing protein [Flavobacteriales bacterium]|nr:T9SS type A sorting domain-containing protein [Flavobacteriales bacterium]